MIPALSFLPAFSLLHIYLLLLAPLPASPPVGVPSAPAFTSITSASRLLV
jgi:hypothetical protein